MRLLAEGPTAPLNLTRGYSQDHRPDLKQIMAGITMDAEGYVLAGQMLADNTSDVKWNATWVTQLDQDFPKDFWKDTCYIADSAMFSEAAISDPTKPPSMTNTRRCPLASARESRICSASDTG